MTIDKIGTNGIALIFDNPSSINAKKKCHLWGNEEDLMRSSLAAFDIRLDECTLMYAHQSQDRDVVKASLPEIRVDLLERLSKMNVQKILLVGAVARSSLLQQKSIGNVDHFRGESFLLPLPSGDVFCVTTIPPYFCTSAPDRFRDLIKDLNKLLTQSKPQDPPEIDIRVCRDINSLSDELIALKAASVVSVDIETAGFDFLKDDMYAIGFGVKLKNGTFRAVIVPEDQMYDPVTVGLVSDFFRHLISSGTTWVLHNATFDLKFLFRYCDLQPDEWVEALVDDTILMSYLLDERPIASRATPHGLKTLSRTYFDAPDFKFSFDTFFKTPHAERDWQTLYDYLALDVAYTYKLYDALLEEFKNDDGSYLVKSPRDVYYQLIRPAVIAFSQIEYRGAPIDRNYLNTQKLLYDTRLTESANKIQSIRKTLVGDAATDINLNSPVQVAKMLYDELKLPAGKKRSTDKETLQGFIQAHEDSVVGDLLKALLEYRNLAKIQSTYIIALIEQSETDGSVHTRFNMNGTSTGRLSSSDPNLQNIPAWEGPVIRKAFIAPPGFFVASVDFSQIELRMAGHLSNDQNIIQAYKDGRDIHTEVASAAFELPYDEVPKKLRSAAKFIDFGILYGRSAQSLVESPDLAEFNWTIRQAERFIDNFLGQFANLKTWMSTVQRTVRTQQELRSETGRLRRWPLLWPKDVNLSARQAVNFPVQSLASDFTLHALIKVHYFLKDFESFLVMTVHDELVLCVKYDEAHIVLPFVKETMLLDHPIEDLRIPLEVDIEVGTSWGDLTDWEGIKYFHHPESDSVLAYGATQFDNGIYLECNEITPLEYWEWLKNENPNGSK